jgi:hypothetical protein
MNYKAVKGSQDLASYFEMAIVYLWSKTNSNEIMNESSFLLVNHIFTVYDTQDDLTTQNIYFKKFLKPIDNTTIIHI